MMHCDTIKELLSDYIDNSLEPNLRSQIKEHLVVCPDCEKLVQQVKSITIRLNQTSKIITSNEFDKNLRARIMGADKRTSSSIPFRGMIYGLSGLTAAAVVYFITTTTIFSSDTDPIQPVNFQQQTGVQQNQIIKQQPQVNIQPVNKSQDAAVVVDSTKSKPAPLENRDINLVEGEK